MYNIIQHSHSGLMWLVVTLIVLSVLFSFLGLLKKGKTVSPTIVKLFSISVWAVHIQILLGAVLYFISPKVQLIEGFMKSSDLRFNGLEHPLMMIIAAVLITVGYSKSKKKTEAVKKNKTIFIFYLLTLIIILAMIPWKVVLA